MKFDTKETIRDWLFVLPFYHFMRGISKPFMIPEYDPENIVFFNELDWELSQGLVLENAHNV